MAPPPRKKGKEPAEPSDGPAPPVDGILQDLPEPIATVKFSDFPNLIASYKSCVEEIIKEMENGSGPNFTFFDKKGNKKCCVPVTPGKDYTPSGVYTIALEDGEGARLLLVADKHQNWFRGIVTTKGRRYEIDGFEAKVMVGSQSLHTPGRYYELTNKTPAEVKVGYNSFVDSFYNLAGHNEKNKDYKTAIAVLLIMLFEAPRFPAVFARCLNLLENMCDGLVGEVLKKLINNWSDISLKFFKANGTENEIWLTDQTAEPVKKVAADVTLLCGSMYEELFKNENQGKKKGKQLA